MVVVSRMVVHNGPEIGISGERVWFATGVSVKILMPNLMSFQEKDGKTWKIVCCSCGMPGHGSKFCVFTMEQAKLLKCEMEEWKIVFLVSRVVKLLLTRSKVRANVSMNTELAGGVVAAAAGVPPAPAVMPVAVTYASHYPRQASWDAPVSSGWGVPSVSPGWNVSVPFGHPTASAAPPPALEAHVESKSP